MKLGNTVDLLDQVLIGRLSFDSSALSIFANKCESTNGPFFIDLAID
jgi:hypothetical protein